MASAEPLLHTADFVWTHYPQNNAFDGNGAANVDLNSDNKSPVLKTVEEAKSEAISKGYAGFTYAPGSGQVWRLKTVSDPSSFRSASWVDVYVLGDGSGDSVTDAGSSSWCRCRRRRSDDAAASAWKRARIRAWKKYAGWNAYDGHGAVNVDLESDNNKPMIKTLEKAKADAVANGYAGFTYEPATGRMWRLKTVTDPYSFKYAKWAEVYVLDEHGGAKAEDQKGYWGRTGGWKGHEEPEAADKWRGGVEREESELDIGVWRDG